MDNHLHFLKFPWHILRHILLPQNRKTIKKGGKIILSAYGGSFEKILSATATRGISAFNFRWFQQPIRSCGIVLTANQHSGQSLTIETTNLWATSSPILARPRKRECMRTAKIWPDLRLSPDTKVGQTGEKNIRFQTKTDTCGRGLNRTGLKNPWLLLLISDACGYCCCCCCFK